MSHLSQLIEENIEAVRKYKHHVRNEHEKFVETNDYLNTLFTRKQGLKYASFLIEQLLKAYTVHPLYKPFCKALDMIKETIDNDSHATRTKAFNFTKTIANIRYYDDCTSYREVTAAVDYALKYAANSTELNLLSNIAKNALSAFFHQHYIPDTEAFVRSILAYALELSIEKDKEKLDFKRYQLSTTDPIHKQIAYDDPRKFCTFHFYKEGKVLKGQDTGLSYNPLAEHPISFDVLRVRNNTVYFTDGLHTHLKDQNIVYQIIVDEAKRQESIRLWNKTKADLENEFYEDVAASLNLSTDQRLFMALKEWVLYEDRWSWFVAEEDENSYETKYNAFIHGWDLLQSVMPEI